MFVRFSEQTVNFVEKFQVGTTVFLKIQVFCSVTLGENFATFRRFNDPFVCSNLIAPRHRITSEKVWIFKE